MNRFLNLAKNIALSNFIGLKDPYRFTCILTYKCQLKCQMCNIWQKKSDNELSFDEIKNFFEKSNKFSWINLSGGEIFLRADLLDIMKVIFENCKQLYLLDFPTNGFKTDLIVKNVKEILRLSGPRKIFVTVSLDGTPELHNRIRNTPESWERAVETFNQLKKLKSSRFNVFFGLTLQSSNADKFHEIYESAAKCVPELSYNDFHINLAQKSQHYYGNAENPESMDNKVVLNHLKKLDRLTKKPLLSPVSFLEKRYQRLLPEYLTKNRTPIPCQALSSSFFMDPAGHVYPCSMFDKEIGNIKEFDFDLYKLWNSPKRHILRKEIAEEKCPHCWTPCEAYQSILANLLPFRKND